MWLSTDELVQIFTRNKYRGTICDDTLKWYLNIEAITKKGQQRLHLLRKIRFFNGDSTVIPLLYDCEF